MAVVATNKFKATMKTLARESKAIILLEDDTVLDTMLQARITSSGYYFTSTTRLIEVKLSGVGYDLLNKRIRVFLRAITGSGDLDYEEIRLGDFLISDQTSDIENNSTIIKGYDQMGVMGDIEYSAGDLVFPCTVAELAGQIATKFSLNLNADFTKLPTSDYQIPEDLYKLMSGSTYRDILSEIAGATASMAIFSTNGDLEFRPLAKTTSEKLTYTNLFKIRIKSKYGPVNSVVLARTPAEDNVALRDEESITTNGLTELKLANNEILDDKREELISPIMEAVKGFEFYPFSDAVTEGHGWHEPGDRIIIDDENGHVNEVIVTDVALTIGAGVQETISGSAPDATITNYNLAGGITKSIYTTEIKVDKQNQKIESTVKKQEELEGKTNESFTQISQDLETVFTAVQNAGGSNLIQNSAGYEVDSRGYPERWTTEVEEGGSVAIGVSADATNNGSISHSIFELKGATIRQRVIVTADDGTENTPVYSFAVKLKKTAALGTGSIILTDGVSTYPIIVAFEENAYYKEYQIQGIVPKNNYIDVIVTGSADSDFTITDMMLSQGGMATTWTQANGEFANTRVSIGVNGVRVKSTMAANSYTEQGALGFIGYNNGQKIYGLNEHSVSSNMVEAKTEILMPPLKLLSRRNGWALVKQED